MNRRERLMATLHGEAVDRPAVSFYELNGLDENTGDGDPYNIYTHPSWKPLLEGRPQGWRKSWYYEYNFENEFPYTPNVRGVRTDQWKYVHYPEGNGQPDKHLAELYNVKDDPLETRNLINSPQARTVLAGLKKELLRLQKETGALPDRMPASPQLRMENPDPAIR